MNVQASIDNKRDWPAGVSDPAESARGAVPLALAEPVIVRARRAGDDRVGAIGLGYEDPMPLRIRDNPGRIPRRITDRVLLRYVAVIAIALIAWHEMHFSTLQSVWLSGIASRSSFDIAPGPNPAPLSN